MSILPPIFNEPYPAPEASKRSFFIAVGFGIFIALFLHYFEPFDISNREDSIWYLGGFGAISFAVLLVFLLLIPLLLPSFFRDNSWNLSRQLGYTFIILFCIATFNGLYTNYVNELPFSWSNYAWIINRTFVLGFIPFSFLTMLDYIRRKNRSETLAHTLKVNYDQKPEKELISIETSLKNEQLVIDTSTFVYAKSEGNYVDIFEDDNHSLSKSTYRINLTGLEIQLTATEITRCHHSFMVNLLKVQSVSGNAQGLKLHLREGDAQVPVSRKYLTDIREKLKNQEKE